MEEEESEDEDRQGDAEEDVDDCWDDGSAAEEGNDGGGDGDQDITTNIVAQGSGTLAMNCSLCSTSSEVIRESRGGGNACRELSCCARHCMQNVPNIRRPSAGAFAHQPFDRRALSAQRPMAGSMSHPSAFDTSYSSCAGLDPRPHNPLLGIVTQLRYWHGLPLDARIAGMPLGICAATHSHHVRRWLLQVCASWAFRTHLSQHLLSGLI